MKRFVLAALVLLASIGVANTAGQKVGPIDVTTCTSGQFVNAVNADATVGCGAPTVPTAANPSATAGPTVVNGSASTFMRSDGAPAVQLGSGSQKGIVQVDGTTVTASSGVISAVQPTGANPTATASDTAVNGSAPTFMRSDAAPAVQKASASQFGIVEVDGSTVTATAGVLSASGAATQPPGGSSGNLQTNNGSGGFGAFGGTSCTNQFPRSLNASGAATCASVANTDLANSSITLNAGSGVGLTAPGAMTLGSTYTFGATSDTPRFAGLGLGGAAAGANTLKIYGGTSGSITLAVPGAAGSNTLTLPAGTTDFTATGGTSQFVKQASTGAALTVARPACADLSDSASGCSNATPTVKSMASISWVPTTNVNNAIVFTANSALTITAIKARIIAAVGSTAAISVIKAASGTACTTGSGTNLIASSATVDANTASTTNQAVTLAGSGAPSVSAGDTVCLQTTNGANFASGTGAGGITFEYSVP